MKVKNHPNILFTIHKYLYLKHLFKIKTFNFMIIFKCNQLLIIILR